MNCPVCNALVHWDTDRCPKCRNDVGAPNVRLVNTKEEKAALQTRYAAAIEKAKTRDAENTVRRFGEIIGRKSRAVVNVSADFLWTFLRQKRSLYVGYEILVDGGFRKPSSFEDDSRRRGVDALLFGSMASHITCAALSLDGTGLQSYGIAALTLSDQTTSASATLLEQNSYNFVSKHRLSPGDSLPAGYRCVWGERDSLAVAKLAARISKNTNDARLAQLLLKGNGTRVNDEFIEVHIFGPFDWQAVEGVVIHGGKLGEHERQLLKNSRDLAEQAGISWRQ